MRRRSAPPARLLLVLVFVGCARGASPANPVVVTVAPPPDPLADARRQDGFVTFWRKQERLWLGVRRADLGVPFLFCHEQTRGVGEHEPRLTGTNVGRCVAAAFHRNGRQLQLRALNLRYRAPAGSPEARAVRDSFSDSLIAAAPLVAGSASATAAGALVVDAGALLLTDIPGLGSVLEESYRQSYALDPPTSGFGVVRASPRQATVDVSAHYRVTRLAPPPLVTSAASAARPPPPATLVDARSLFLGLQYRFGQLPPPYPARAADDRLGHLVQTHYDYRDDLQHDARVHKIARWRLERAQPGGAPSRPKQPIVYWLDANIPARYRGTIKEAILSWNAAFEKLGFTGAIEVRDAPAGGPPDQLELPHAVVRWFIQARGRASARGGIATDPRTGEILHAHIVIPDNWMRGVRSSFLETRTPTLDGVGGVDADACAYGEAAAQELAFALDVQEARGRGAGAPDGAAAEAMVQAVLKEVMMHETGHTLGLMHNFRASTSYTEEQLEDPAFTRKHGIAASVMDYNPVNLALRGKPQAALTMAAPGPYDEWALEYAYRPFAPGEEAAGLAKIAARAGEPGLAFSSDLDAGADDLVGVDPEVNRRDLGRDALAFARRRFLISRELWRHLEGERLPEGESEAVVRRGFERAFFGVTVAARLAVKHVGGIVHRRTRAGAAEAPFAPVPAARQRQALALLENEVLAPSAFRFPASLLNRLAVDPLTATSSDPAYRLYDNVAYLQRTLLAQLLSAGVADRLVEMESRAPAGTAFPLAELYDRLLASVWHELRAGGDIPPLRRALQRRHLELLSRLALRPPAGAPEDVRALARANLRTLARWLPAARGGGRGAVAVRAHLDDSLAEVNRTLAASVQVGAD